MKVTQEKLPASQIGLEIEVTPEMSKKAYEGVIQKFMRQANIPGFRKGKVPRQVIVQRFGSQALKAQALEELVDSSLKAAIKQESIDAIGNFQLKSDFEDLLTQYEPGGPITFNASIDVPPVPTVTGYKGLSVKAEEVKPDFSKVDAALEQYRDRNATLVPVEDRGAQMGDIATIDFTGATVDASNPDAEPVPFPGGSAEDFPTELKEGQFIPGFVEGMIGMQVGETKEISVKFPDDYNAENLAGQAAIFTITIKELKVKELPELDDDFAQEVSEYQTLAELRASLEARFTEEAADKTRANTEESILNELLNHIEVDLPETLVERELSYMLQQTAYQLQSQGIDIRQLFNEDTIPLVKERSRPDAVDRIKRTLALGEVAKQESIEVSEEELTAKIEEFMQGLNSREVDPQRVREVVTEDLLKEKILDWLVEHATVELVPEGSLQPNAEEAAAEAIADALDELAAATQADDAVEVSATVVSDEPEPAAPEPEFAESDTDENPVKEKTEKKKKAPKAEATVEVEAEAEAAPKKATKSKKK